MSPTNMGQIRFAPLHSPTHYGIWGLLLQNSRPEGTFDFDLPVRPEPQETALVNAESQTRETGHDQEVGETQNIGGSIEHVEDIRMGNQNFEDPDGHNGDDLFPEDPAEDEETTHQVGPDGRQVEVPECPGCTDEVSPAEAIYLSCGDAWHRDCLNNNFRHALISRNNWPAKCCDQNDHINPQALEAYLDDDVAIMISERQEEYESTYRIYCSNLACGTYIGDDVAHHAIGSYVTCPSCSATTCKVCKCPESQHDDFDDCPEVVSDQNRELAQKEGWRICPRPACSSMIERTEGCDTIDCPACKITFCYRCGEVVQHGIPCNCAGQNEWTAGLGEWMGGGDEDEDEDGVDDEDDDGDGEENQDQDESSPLITENHQ